MENLSHYGSDVLVEKAQQLEPKLYDGNVIKSTSAIVIPDSEETLMLAEESRSKMLLKQQDLMVLENKNSINSSNPSPSCRLTKVEVPKEPPKFSMVNMSLKKLKHHLAGFDMVVKEGTTTTTITEGLWGFEHTKACFRDEIIPFAMEQHRLESKTFEVKMNQVLNENERILEQVINKDIVNIIMNSSMDNASVNMHECKKCLKLETELLKKTDFIEKETYDKSFRIYTTLEKHCISLEVNSQLNQEIFQRDHFVSNQSAPNFDQYFKLNELKAQSQEKDTVIRKLKERIKSLSGNMNEDKTYKQLYDSIKPTCLRSKELCDALINQVNQKKLKGKDLPDNIVTKHTIASEMLKFDVEPIAPKLLNNRTTYSDYHMHTQEQAVILREVVEQGKCQNPLNNSLDSTCKYTKQIQELPIIIRQTCPSINNSSDKLVVVTPKNKDKRVRFTKPVTSSGNKNTKIASLSNLVSNKPMMSSTGIKLSTSASRSQPSGNTKKDKIQQTPSSTQKNKVEAHPKTVKSSFKNKKCVVKPKGTANVQHSKLNANSELICVKCNGCMLSDNHDLCVLNFINDVNNSAKSKSVKKISKRNIWKPTRKVFTKLGYTWRPTGLTFTIVGNAFPLTRITKTTEVPPRKPTALETITPKHVVTLVYSRKLRKSKTNVLVSKPKIIKSISANNKEPSKSWGSIVFDVLSSSLNECRYDGVLSNMSLVKGLKDSVLAMAPTSISSELWLKDEAPDFIIKFLKMTQLRLKAPVRRIRTDNGTEFVNQTLREYYEKIGISHETSVARSPQQNGVVERRNHTLIEAARTMLIYAKALLFLWAEAVATACYTQNRSIIRLRHGKTPYELLHDKPPDLSFFHVFGALCYPTNDSENLGKLQPKADIGIFIGYAPTKKAFRIYNRRTRRIIETIHVDFDELTAMASEYSSSGPALHEMTPATISFGLIPNPPPSTPFVPPSRTD
ncbi:retrovirus-related pol polyprotein from transposon TNT 1-94 [Tanacetum coccineum]